MDILERLEQHWCQSKIQRNLIGSARASQQEINAFEQKYDVVLPADFREYFLRLNGIEEDSEVFCFWPINRLRPVDLKTFNVLQAGQYFYFADFLVECNYYAIYLGNDPFFQNRVVIPDSSKNCIVAQTFTEFLEVYLRDDPKLYVI
jgi:SMI1 / KNR4 family (SUKH-1)